MSNVKPSLTAAQFRATHGDLSNWSATDFEVHEHLVEAEHAHQLVDAVLAEHCLVDSTTAAS